MSHYTKDIEKHSKNNRVPSIVLLCAFVYLISYLGRLSFAAVTVDMIENDGFDKTLLAIPLTAISVTYGFGQLLFGYLGDKLSPEKMIFCGLLLTSGMNLSIPFTYFSVPIMTVMWSINGFAQAMMWPPIVKILTPHLSPQVYRKNIFLIGWGSSLGTIIVYLFAPVAISVTSWRSVFFFSSVLALIVSIIWICSIYKSEAAAAAAYKNKTEVKAVLDKPEPFKGFAVGLLLIIVAAVAMQGVLRDGIATWMPTYITEVFKVESTISILTGVALPAFSMVTIWASAIIYRRCIRNESLCAAFFFVLCTLSVGVLTFASSASAVLSVSMLMVANAATHGVNMMYTSMVVPNFARYGKTSFVTGLINSATYVGSALSTFGVAFIAECFGWGGTMVSWLIVSVVGTAIALLSTPWLNRLKKLNKAE